jgi:hypothetical protein
MSLFYDFHGNDGAYVRQDIDYTPPDGGAEWLGKTGLSFNAHITHVPIHGKYTGATFSCHDWVGAYPAGYGWRDFRKPPAYGTALGYRTYTSFGYDEFGFANNNNSPHNDFTGWLIADQGLEEDSNDWYMSATLYDPTSPVSRVDFPAPDGTFAGMTQKFGVASSYRMTKPKTFFGDSLPLGTILKHTSRTNLGTSITASEDSLEQTLGNFEIILRTDRPTKVDTAKEVPTVVYDIPPQDGVISGDFAASVDNEEGTFYTHADPKPVYEGRTFDLPLPGTFPTYSGQFDPSDYERYIGISNREGILASKFDLSTPWVNIVTTASGVMQGGVVVSGITVSGLITHFETSNYVPEGTYFFFTVSGAIPSFFQKNPDDGFWIDYSAGLPASPITIIRVDDLI